VSRSGGWLPAYKYCIISFSSTGGVTCDMLNQFVTSSSPSRWGPCHQAAIPEFERLGWWLPKLATVTVTKGLVALLKAVSGVTVWRLVVYIQVLTVTRQTAIWRILMLTVDLGSVPSERTAQISLCKYSAWRVRQKSSATGVSTSRDRGGSNLIKILRSVADMSD
jgi:hypothetical protein